MYMHLLYSHKLPWSYYGSNVFTINNLLVLLSHWHIETQFLSLEYSALLEVCTSSIFLMRSFYHKCNCKRWYKSQANPCRWEVQIFDRETNEINSELVGNNIRYTVVSTSVFTYIKQSNWRYIAKFCRCTELCFNVTANFFIGREM